MAKNDPVMRFGESVEVVSDTTGPSMTRQEFADECDVNAIMARYDNAVGGWPFAPPSENFVDFAAVPQSLQEAMTLMMDASEAFMRLPARARAEFDNDPLRFVEYASNPRNVGRLREWGLAEPEKAPDPPMRVEVVNQPVGDPKSPRGPAAVKVD